MNYYDYVSNLLYLYKHVNEFNLLNKKILLIKIITIRTKFII